MNRTTLGILCAMGASVAFTLNDVGIKFLAGDYALHQIVFFRTLSALTITMAIIIPLEGGFHLLKTKHPMLHIARGLAVVASNMVFFMGLAALPLAEATAIFFVSPLVITLFSVIFLKEKVGPYRWLAVVIGLVGAIVIMRPGTAAFQIAAIFPVLAAFGYATLHMLTRKLGATEKASTLAFYVQLIFLVVSGSIGIIAGDGKFASDIHPSVSFLSRAWVMPDQRDLMIMLAVGLCSASGGYLISQAYRLCAAATIAPFEYLALVLAIVWGIVFFVEWPDFVAWTGIALILSAGLCVLWRENVLKKRIASERPMPRVR
ncbi:DMT family transporter [Pseudahrensia aquimaris]|uniref:DMT family transporter n=1 Tax=Pseudahrensia aquimaris TaxID=744461 RepID=A0ABW3FD65_9HYPH